MASTGGTLARMSHGLTVARRHGSETRSCRADSFPAHAAGRFTLRHRSNPALRRGRRGVRGSERPTSCCPDNRPIRRWDCPRRRRGRGSSLKGSSILTQGALDGHSGSKPRIRHRAEVGRTHQLGVLREHAAGVTGLGRLPLRQALADFFCGKTKGEFPLLLILLPGNPFR